MADSRVTLIGEVPTTRADTFHLHTHGATHAASEGSSSSSSAYAVCARSSLRCTLSYGNTIRSIEALSF